LGNLFEHELRVDFGKCSLQKLSRRLPKVLVDDLGMVRD
jgi:hypothetical protein